MGTLRLHMKKKIYSDLILISADRKSAPPEALANQGRVTAVSVPLREFAEDSVRSLEGLDVPSPPMPQGHLPLHLLRQGVLGPEPHAPMRHFLPAQRGIGL